MLLRLVINAAALFIATYIVPGIELRGWGALLGAAVLLGLVNALIRPILLILTLPINLLTLGLFTLVVNAGLFALVAGLVPGFEVAGFGAAFLGSLVLAAVSMVLSWLIR